MTKDRLIKLGFSLYFLAVGISFLLLRNAPTQGYELSIYEHTPVFTIGFLLASTAAGIGLIAYSTFSPRKNRWWVVGLSMLLLNTFTVLTLPYFRSYYAYMHADPAAHWAWIEEMLTTHRIPPGNIYPALHLDILNLSLLTTVSPRVLVALFPALLSMLWMLYIYLFATALFKDRRYAIMASGAGCVFLFLTYQIPIIAQSIGHFSLPLIFYLYFMSLSHPGPAYRLPLVAMLVGLPFTHPIPFIVAVFMLVVLELAQAGYRRFWPSGAGRATVFPGHFDVTPLVLAVIVFFLWISSRAMFAIQAKYTYTLLTGKYSVSAVSELGATNQLTHMELVNWILRDFGHLAIFLILAAIGVFYMIFRKDRREFAYALLFVMAAFLGLFFQTALDVAMGQEALYYRSMVMNQLVNLSPIMVGLGLIALLRHARIRQSLKVGTVVVVIGLAWTVSLFALFPSPWTYQRSIQITRQDVAGQRWLFAQDRLGYLYTGLNIPHQITFFVFEQFTITEADEYIQRSATELTRGPHQYENIPPHFGLQQGKRWGELIPFDISFILSDRFTKAMVHPVLSKTWVGFLERRDITQTDLDALQSDSTVDRLYSNGPTSILFVRMTRG